MLGCNTIWSISSEEYSQRWKQFDSIGPTNGFITGQQAKDYFMQCKLPTKTLCQIWNLADYDKDGKMNFHEFSIAMHLIKRSLEGVQLPKSLPKEMMVPPNNFAFPDIIECNRAKESAAAVFNNRPIPSYSEATSSSAPGCSTNSSSPPPLPRRTTTQTSWEGEWAVLAAVRPRYRLQFNQQDRHKRGYLTGEEAKQVLLRSGLPRAVLARVWQLADVDQDGRLSCDEFCVAMHLVEQARAGRALPTALPDSLVPPSMLKVSNNNTLKKSTTIQQQHHQQQQQQNFNDSKFSESRPATLRVAPDSPHVANNEYVDSEAFPIGSPNTAINSRDAYFNPREKQIHPPPDFRYSMREGDKKLGTVASAAKQLQSIVDERDREKELLQKLKERQEYLIAALAAEEEKCVAFQERLSESRKYVEDRKIEIEQMREERDRIVEGTAWVEEEIEAAKAEQGRCKRDRDTLLAAKDKKIALEGIISTNGVEKKDIENKDVEKVIVERKKRQQSIESLQQEIQELEEHISVKSKDTSERNSQIKQLQNNVVHKQIPEIERLKQDVATRRNQVNQLIEDRDNRKKSDDGEQIKKQNNCIEAGDTTQHQLPCNGSTTNANNNSASSNNQPIRIAESPPPPIMKTERYVAQFPFTGRQSDELTFKNGDIILVRIDAPQNAPTGWLYGRHESGGLFGLFPEVYVKKCPMAEQSTVTMTMSITGYSDITPSSSGGCVTSPDTDDSCLFNNTLPQGATIKKAPSVFNWVEAIYPWMIEDGSDDNNSCYQGDDEESRQLSFRVGERIKVLEKSSNDWWKGELVSTNDSGFQTTQTGWFPQIYVKSIDSGHGGDDDCGGEVTNQNQSKLTSITNKIDETINSPYNAFDEDDDGCNTTKYSNLNFAASCDISNNVPQQQFSSDITASEIDNNQYCIVLYPYESSVPGDLTVRAGDIVRLLDESPRCGQFWWKGQLKSSVDINVRPNQETGLFPAHYARRLTKQEMENTEALSALTSEYYTSITLENGTGSSGRLNNTSITTNTTASNQQVVYDDIDQSTTTQLTNPPITSRSSNIAHSPTSNEIEEPSENNQTCSTYSNYCSLADNSDSEHLQFDSLSHSPSINSSNQPPLQSSIATTVSLLGTIVKESRNGDFIVTVGQQVVVMDTNSKPGWIKVEVSTGSQSGSSRTGWIPRDCININNIEQSDEQDPMTASGYDQCGYDAVTPKERARSNKDISGTQTTTSTSTTSGSQSTPTTTMAPTQSSTTPNSNTEECFEDPIKVGNFLIAMYPYNAQNPDELSFSKSDLIRLISKDEPDWWKGCNQTCGGICGLFPVNYVRHLDPINNGTDAEILEKYELENCGGAMNQYQQNDQMVYSTVTGRPISWYIDGQVTFNALLTEDEKRRQFYIIELIETEKAYYDDLQEVHRVFYEPIKKSGILSAEDLRHIFLNWTDLIAKSYNFYMALKIRQDKAGFKQPVQCIGDILLSNFPNFIVYVRFCSMQNHAIMRLERRKQQMNQFKELCDQCELNLRCQKMPMSSYFLKPMQRITKYKLLVENILKHTEDEHPDRGDMEEAVAAARSLCEAVNEGIREKENSERLEWIQEHVKGAFLTSQGDDQPNPICFNSATNSLGHRKLIYSGTLFKAKSGKELVGFLFNDFMMLTTPQYNTGGCPFVFPLETSSSTRMQFKMYKKPILLNRVLIMTGIPSNQNSLSVTAATSVFGSCSNNEIFTIREAGSDHVLKGLSVNDRDKWVERLVAASLQYIEIENSVREISMSIRRTAGVGRLIVTILEGINLKGISNNENKVNAYCEVSLGNQLRRTKVVTSTYNPKWHCNMQFLIKNLELDILCLSVFDKDYFAPNEYLGRTEISVKEIKNQKCGANNKGPIEKRLKLIGVQSGEILVRFDIALFKIIEEPR